MLPEHINAFLMDWGLLIWSISYVKRSVWRVMIRSFE